MTPEEREAEQAKKDAVTAAFKDIYDKIPDVVNNVLTHEQFKNFCKTDEFID